MNHRLLRFAYCTASLIAAGCGNGGIPVTNTDAGDGAVAPDTIAPYVGGTGGGQGGSGGSPGTGATGGWAPGGSGGSAGAGGAIGGSGGSFPGTGGAISTGGVGTGGYVGGSGGFGPGGSGGSIGGSGGSDTGGAAGYGGFAGGIGGGYGTGGAATGGYIGTGGFGGATGGAAGSGGYYGTGGIYGSGGFYGTGGFYCPPYGGAGGSVGYPDGGVPATDGGLPSPYPCQPPLPPDPVRDDLAKAYCGAGERCCKDYEFFPYGQGPFCVWNVSQSLTGVLGQMRASQAAGRSTIDEAAYKACVQNLQTGACKDVAGLLVLTQITDVPGCPRITQGKVAEGEGCDRDFECLDGLYCDGSTCQRRPGAGQDCPDGACASGLYCRGFNTGPRCVTKEPDGRLCDNPQECASGACSYSAQYSTNICGAPSTCTGK